MKLVKAMRWIAPVIALGRPGEAIGVGRILANEESWRAAITSLIDRATIVFCIPSAHEGTRWEIAHIIERFHLHKTIFVMPPKSVFFGRANELEDDWAKLAKEMREQGYLFPLYQAAGLLFVIDASNKSITRQPFQSQIRSL